MKKFLLTAAALAMLAAFIAPAQAAIRIVTATAHNGVVYVLGSGAAKGARIRWESIAVTRASKINGGFAFVSVLPGDCTGTLTDGTSTVDVPVLRCTPVTAGPPAPVPKTGQTVSFAPGDDGTLQKGVASTALRFTDNANGTITDNLTGLIWLRNASCGGARNWQAALDFVAGINSGANDCDDKSNAGVHQTDWRLPNRNELTSLLDLEHVIPALPTGYPFTTFQVSNYWSSTTWPFNPLLAWAVDFVVGGVFADGKSFASYYVIAVRGGL